MIIKTFICGMIRNNCYVLHNDDSKEAVIIDPGANNINLETYLITKQLDVRYILLTHGHGDHTGGIDRIKDLFPECKLVAAKKEAKFLFDRSYSMGQGGIVADINVYDNDVLDLCGISIKVIETPGHTPGGVCYYIESEKVLFSGDTLFQFSVGRTDFPGGNTQDLLNSITQKLFALPDETLVLPGHEGATEIGKEKVYNPFVS